MQIQVVLDRNFSRHFEHISRYLDCSKGKYLFWPTNRVRVEFRVQKERKNLLNERVFEMMIIGHITLKIWKALSSLWNVAKGLMPVVWTALIFSQLDIGKLLKRTWEDLLRVSGPCTGDQGTQKASGKVAVLSKREDFAKENWDFIWTFHFSLLKLAIHFFPVQPKTYSVTNTLCKFENVMKKKWERTVKRATKRSFSFVTGSITWG